MDFNEIINRVAYCGVLLGWVALLVGVVAAMVVTL